VASDLPHRESVEHLGKKTAVLVRTRRRVGRYDVGYDRAIVAE